MIPAERAHVQVAGISHPGMSGKNNEDRFAVSAYRLGFEFGQPSVLAVVADGIGGHRAGEVAAEIAVETISSLVAQSDGAQPVNTLSQAVIEAGQAIFHESETDPQQRGMGSTCACAWVIGNRLFTASVGDSRIYLLRGGRILQLTTDHTWVQEAVDSGMLTPDQARRHPNAHVIRRYLGARQGVVPDLRLRLQPAIVGQSDFAAETNQGATLLPDDLVLLCSDGLTDVVSDEEILAQVRQASHLEDSINQLLDLANRRGGPDNITMILLRMPPGERPTTPMLGKLPRLTPRRSRLPGLAIAGILGLALALAVYIGVNTLDWQAWLPGFAPTAANTAAASPPATGAPGMLVKASPTPTLNATRPAASLTPAGSVDATSTPQAPPTGGPTLTPWPTNTAIPAP